MHVSIRSPLAGAAVLAAVIALAAALAPAASPYDFGNPSAQEEYMRQLMNRARSDPEAEADLGGLDNTHADDVPDGTYDVGEGITITGVADQSTYWSRYQAPRQPLAWSAPLNASAANHCDDMYDFGFAGHYTVASSHGYDVGDGPGDRGFAEGYPNHFVFENLAFGAPQGYYSVDEMHRGLFDDLSVAGRGHRRNIIHSFLREVGISYLSMSAPNGQGWNDSWTIDLASDYFLAGGHVGEDDDPDTVYLTGVAYDDGNSDGAYQPGEELPGLQVLAYTPSGDMLAYYGVTADGGGYSLPLLDRFGNDILAGQQIDVVVMDPVGKRRLTASRTVQQGTVVWEDDETETPMSWTQRLNVGLDAEAADFVSVIDGDANWDGVVNVGDLALLAANWQTGRIWPEADFNGDGTTNVGDLAILAGNWNAGGGGATVPEPATVLLVLAGAAVLRRRR